MPCINSKNLEYDDMKKNQNDFSEKQSENQSCKYQKQVDLAIQDSCEKYQQHREQAEKQIDQGARTTDHRIKL